MRKNSSDWVAQRWPLLVAVLVLGCGQPPPDTGAPGADARYKGGPSPNAPPAESQPWALESQYRKAAAQQATNPNLKPWQHRYDVPLNQQQSDALDGVLKQLKENLAKQSIDTSPRITYMAIQTGEPDRRLLVNIWFVAQLAQDADRWRYELSVEWTGDKWIAKSGAAQQGPREGRGLSKDFVQKLITADDGGAKTEPHPDAAPANTEAGASAKESAAGR